MDKQAEFDLCYRDYVDLVESFAKKYGKPTDIKEVWVNERYKGRADKLGTALARGHLTLGTVWEADCSVIHVMISGNASNISISVVYGK